MFNHCDKITELAEELLTEMRKHYNGQIGVGVVASWRDCGFTFNGYDYLTVSVYPIDTNRNGCLVNYNTRN